ncbi:MAG: hypothetical protein C0602_02815 [Denitrovibrio sp.]|nr:MAG: hypothetical protein C0602_02815 [Denitrovibrio sp.]
MKKIAKLFLFGLFCITIAGCAGTYGDGPKLIDGKPEWYYTPSKDGKIGGVGVSGIHKDGKTGQKKLAVERALAEIARQMGVKVESYSNLKSQTSGGSSATSGQSHSFFTVDGHTVNARIEQMWEDRYSGELYIWMVTN